MDLARLRCFVVVAEELHFARAARRLEMTPSALGRHVRLLEEELGARLLLRTTRSVALTEDGAAVLEGARDLLAHADTFTRDVRARTRRRARALRLGAMDTAAAGLVPGLLHDFRASHPDVAVQLLEDKTIRLLPRLLSGRLDLALVRPPEQSDDRLVFEPLLHETAVVAVPDGHALARRRTLSIAALAGEPLIVPDRRSRPHSHDLTIKLFERAGTKPIVAQVAEEKQTIVNLVAAGFGLAIVPRWTSRMAISGIRYVPLRAAKVGSEGLLPLAAAWLRGARDPLRDAFLGLLRANLRRYGKTA